MRSFNGLLTALLATCGAAQVGAAPILVDAFNGPDMFVADTTINGVGVQVGPIGPVNPPANTLSRTVGHNFLAGTNPGGTGSSVTVGSQTFPSGALSIENQPTLDSTVFVSWVLPTGFINTYAAGPLALAFDVLAASGSVTFEVSWRGASLGSRSIASFSGPGSALALLALVGLALAGTVAVARRRRG
jgi:hypothetical protein